MLRNDEARRAMQVRDDWRDTEATADHFGLMKRLLEELRWRGDGPPYYKPSHKTVLYRLSEVERWFEQHRRGGTAA